MAELPVYGHANNPFLLRRAQNAGEKRNSGVIEYASEELLSKYVVL